MVQRYEEACEKPNKKWLLFIFILYLCTQNLKQIGNEQEKKTSFVFYRTDAGLRGYSSDRTLMARSKSRGKGWQSLVVDGVGR
jgi:hypothetical protein